MKRILAFLLTSALSLSVLTACGGGNDDSSGSSVSAAGSQTENSSSSAKEDQENSGKAVMNLFTWDGYLPDDVLEGYTEKTGVKVNYSNFESNEEMLTKIQSGNDGYDVIIASDYIIDIAIREGGIISELDTSKIPNFSNIDPVYQSQYYDPENKYTVPFSAGTPLIVYDPAMVKLDITTYSDLWDPSLEDSVVMMDDARNVIGITLKTLGKSFNETDEAVLEQAKEKLMELKPNIRSLTVNNTQDLLISGEASVGYMFASQVALALEANPDLVVVYPTEGMGFGIDSAFIPENAANKDNAYAFLDYILEPQVGADISSQIYYLCPNQASAEFLPESYTSNTALFIPSDVLKDTEFIKDVGDATSIYDRIWTEFKQ